MNKKRVALALAAALGINTLMVTVGQVGEQITIAHAQTQQQTVAQPKADYLDFTIIDGSQSNEAVLTLKDGELSTGDKIVGVDFVDHQKLPGGTLSASGSATYKDNVITISGLTASGIYSFDVKIQRSGKTTTETYRVSFRKVVREHEFNAEFNVNYQGIEVTKAMFEGKEIASGDLVLYDENGQEVSRINYPTNKLFFVSGLKEGNVFEVGYTPSGGIEERVSLVLTVQKESTIKGVDFATLDTELSSFGTISYVSQGNSAANSTTLYNALGGEVKGKDVSVDVTVVDSSNKVVPVVTYTQTLGNDGATRSQVWGGSVAVGAVDVLNNKVDININSVSTVSTAASAFVPYLEVGYGSVVANSTTLVGDFKVSLDGKDEKVYFDTKLTQNSFKTDSSGATVATDTAFANIDTPVASITPSTPVNFDLPTLEHGYDSIGVVFSNAGDEKIIDDVNTAVKGLGYTNSVLAVVNKEFNGLKFTTPVVFAVDKLDAATAKVELATSVKKGNVYDVTGTIKLNLPTDFKVNIDSISGFTFGGKSVSKFNTDANGNITFSVEGATASNGVFDYSFVVTEAQPRANTISRKINFTGKVDATQSVQAFSVTSGNEFKLANNSTQNDAQFDYSPVLSIINNQNYDLTISGIKDLDNLEDKNVRVKSSDFVNGNVYTLTAEVKSGKYKGIYYSGMKIENPLFVIEAKDAKSVSNTSASLVIDANFIDKNDIDKVTGGVVQYSEKTTSGSTTTWSDWKDSTTKVEKFEVKEDAITKTVTGLTGGKTYKFRVVYDYNNGTTTEKVYSNETAEVTLPTSSSSSTITGSGGTTTGTSTGSTTINVTTSNSTLTGTSASVTLPSGFRYDSGKNPVAVTFKYKDKDGKIVTETKEQYSNVTARFNGNNVELNGLVPGKDYNEITVDYTDNNGKTRSIILKNVKTISQTQVETYLANVYEVVFGRPADEAGYHFHLDNLKNKKVSLRDFLLNMLNEKEFVEKYKSTEEKIEALYNAIVNRTSDEAGKKFWVDEYKKVLAVYGSETTALKAIADRMVNENELKELADKMGVQW